jgi:N,N'-diacetyllegionaminate synthase
VGRIQTSGWEIMRNKIELIAETAWHHDGDINFMEKLVHSILQDSRADILKLHLTLDLNEYISKRHPIYSFLNDRLFSEDQWSNIITSVVQQDKKLMLLYNDTRAIQFGAQFEPDFVEIHSVCLNDTLLLNSLKDNISSDTNIILGVGGSSLNEIEFALEQLNHSKIVLMFGFQNYPTKYENLSFSKIKRVMNLFPEFDYGYADHCGWDEKNNILVTLMGAALGMEYVEKHVTTDYGGNRTDWNSAISIEMFNEIAVGLEVLDSCRGNGMLKLNAAEVEYSIHGPNKKAAVLNCNVKAGDILLPGMVQYQRSADATDLSLIDLQRYYNQAFSCNLRRGRVLQTQDFKKG